MSDQQKTATVYNDGLVDAYAATVIIALLVSAAVYWLSGL